ncbi:ElaB/YgaM/YqjD family protein [Azotobacter armeniacus]
MSLFKTPRTSLAEERLEKEIHDLMHALEHLRTSASRDTQSNYERLRERAEGLLQQSRHHYHDTRHSLARQCHQVGQCTRDCVRAHPWASLAVGVGAAALFGLLFARGRDH